MENINARITLKSFKWLPSLSHETLCFTAKVLIDGKVVGTAENAGHGGCTFVHVETSKVPRDLDGIDLETIVDELAYAEVDRKEVDKAVRRVLKDMKDKVVFLKPGESLKQGWRIWRIGAVVNSYFTHQTVQQVLAKYPAATILNSKTEDEIRGMLA